MSFYVSLSGLKGAQADLSAVSNNVANVNSTAFKKSKAQFGDIFAAAPMQTTHQVAGQGVLVPGLVVEHLEAGEDGAGSVGRGIDQQQLALLAEQEQMFADGEDLATRQYHRANSTT